MADPSTPEAKNLEAQYHVCPRCKHRRSEKLLKLDDEIGQTAMQMVCADRAVCDALRDRVPGPEPLRIGNPIDYALLPDPPLVRTTQIHRTRNGELASVTANGHSIGGKKR